MARGAADAIQPLRGCGRIVERIRFLKAAIRYTWTAQPNGFASQTCFSFTVGIRRAGCRTFIRRTSAITATAGRSKRCRERGPVYFSRKGFQQEAEEVFERNPSR